jgi:hypothetical protein
MPSMLRVINKPFMLNVIMLSVVMPSVIMLNVVAPCNRHKPFYLLVFCFQMGSPHLSEANVIKLFTSII